MISSAPVTVDPPPLHPPYSWTLAMFESIDRLLNPVDRDRSKRRPSARRARVEAVQRATADAGHLNQTPHGAEEWRRVLSTNRCSSKKYVFTRVRAKFVRTSMTYRFGFVSRRGAQDGRPLHQPHTERHHGLEVTAVYHSGDVRLPGGLEHQSVVAGMMGPELTQRGTAGCLRRRCGRSRERRSPSSRARSGWISVGCVAVARSSPPDARASLTLARCADVCATR
jgi:hypothetical protein